MNLRNDRYYDPPDEEEAKFCEECGEELEWKPDYVGKTPMCSGNWECTNSFCPEKFTMFSDRNLPFPQIVIDMAIELVETRGKLERLEGNVKRLENTNRFLSKLVDKINEETEKSNEIVRDTDYQIRRMEDAIELAYIEEGMSAEGRRIIWLEWSEIKKILTNL
jgi:hypothetical protein